VTTEKDSDILKRLEEWGRKGECSPSFLEFYQRLFRIQSGVEQRIDIPQPTLTEKAALERLERGMPLISFDELALDWSLIQDVFAEVTAAFAGYPGLFGDLPESLSASLPRPILSTEIARAWFEGERLPATANDDEVNEQLRQAIVHATLKPFLVSHAKAVRDLVNQERWRRGYCPVCGGSPDLAYLEKKAGARWLLCSRCDTEWLFQRLECPYCSNQDQEALAYYTDDEGPYRLYICDKCHQYLKAFDLRKAKSEVLLPLERLFTLPLDAQAQELGYSPGIGKVITK